MTAAINPKGRLLARGATALGWADAYLTSTVGQKLVVALTGAGLVLFAVFHMVGNLKMLPGGAASRDGMNAYAYFLKHDLGAWLWAARAGLLAIFLLHLYVALRLSLRAAAARPVGYAVRRYAQAGPASTTMVWTGIVVGAFVVFHLAHFTFGWVHADYHPDGSWTNYLDMPQDRGRQDVYNMVVAGFSAWWISVLYLIAQALLFVHLGHGIPSAFQTLGLKSRRFARALRGLGLAVAGVIFVGNVLIVLAVWIGYVGRVE